MHHGVGGSDTPTGVSWWATRQGAAAHGWTRDRWVEPRCQPALRHQRSDEVVARLVRPGHGVRRRVRDHARPRSCRALVLVECAAPRVGRGFGGRRRRAALGAARRRCRAADQHPDPRVRRPRASLRRPPGARRPGRRQDRLLLRQRPRDDGDGPGRGHLRRTPRVRTRRHRPRADRGLLPRLPGRALPDRRDRRLRPRYGGGTAPRAARHGAAHPWCRRSAAPGGRGCSYGRAPRGRPTGPMPPRRPGPGRSASPNRGPTTTTSRRRRAGRRTGGCSPPHPVLYSACGKSNIRSGS